MIFCKKAYLSFYRGMNKNLDKAIDFVTQCDLKTLSMGRNEIDGEAVYVNRFDYETKDEQELLFETHHRYADIHLLLSGHEQILTAQETALEQVEKDESADYVGSKGTAMCRCRMTTEDALIVFPWEAHKVKCSDGESTKVLKAVVKVRL